MSLSWRKSRLRLLGGKLDYWLSRVYFKLSKLFSSPSTFFGATVSSFLRAALEASCGTPGAIIKLFTLLHGVWYACQKSMVVWKFLLMIMTGHGIACPIGTSQQRILYGSSRLQKIPQRLLLPCGTPRVIIKQIILLHGVLWNACQKSMMVCKFLRWWSQDRLPYEAMLGLLPKEFYPGQVGFRKIPQTLLFHWRELFH